MEIPISWLKKYVSVLLSPEELAHRLTMGGTEVGSVRHIGGDWDRDKILIGSVLNVEPHPNADRLRLPSIDLGNGEIATVVCGGPNLLAGQKIAFAREGARLLNIRSGKVETLRSTNIRGIDSAGMVCSESELGLGDNHQGILVLDDTAPVGMPLFDYLGDSILEIEITPNRPDCLSVLGVAHEIAALTGENVIEPNLGYLEEGDPVEGQIKVEIMATQLCSRYTASLLTGVTVSESPHWMQDALIKSGMRPINNIVDATNYVMLEYGQPLHAFDFDFITGETILVRKALPGEKLTTLDGEKRELQPQMLVIADAKKSLAVAGVIGGIDSEVRSGTKTILLESANFHAGNIRRTAGDLRLSTEASYRFERGIRPELVPKALRRAIQLILQIAGGKAAKGVNDEYPGEIFPPILRITSRRMTQVLGVDFGIKKALHVLRSLGFKDVTPKGKQYDSSVLHVEAPYWRSDISIEEDLIEEVARVVGYDKIPTTMLSKPIPHHEPQPLRSLKEKLRDLLVAAGMQEVISYPLTDQSTLEDVGALDEIDEPLKIANPMSNEMKYLRTTLRGSMLKTLAYNRNISQNTAIRIFEIGRVFIPKGKISQRDLPNEQEMLIGVLSGPRFQTSWLVTKGDNDFFDAKGVLELLFANLKVSVDYETSQASSLHPGMTAALMSGGRCLGTLGEIHPQVLEKFGLGTIPVALFEISIEELLQVMPALSGGYKEANKFPEADRDFAITVDVTVPSAIVKEIIERHKLVKNSIPFDLYEGEQVGVGKKSICYRVVFQSGTGTLTSAQIDRAQQQILKILRREVGAELRRQEIEMTGKR